MLASGHLLNSIGCFYVILMLNAFRQSQTDLYFSVWILFLFHRTFHGQEERDGLPTAAPWPGRWCAGRAERARGASARLPARGATRAGGDTRQWRQKPGELPPLYTCWNGSRSFSELLFQEVDLLLKILESYFQSRKWWVPPHQGRYQVGSLRLGSVPLSFMFFIVTFCHVYMRHCSLMYWLLFVWWLMSSYLK